MKVTVRNEGDKLSIYVAKKDLEAFVTEMKTETGWGGEIVLDNGWVLELPMFDSQPDLPQTIEAKVISKD